MSGERRFVSPLLGIGIVLFLIGVAVAFFGGESLQMVGLAIQVAGAIALAVNAGRSRQQLLSSDEDPEDPRD
ncbi:MAG: preprotein translocase subunit TatC [Deltaproteobacteria bacterium]|nr:preprotein translocase subunit TatC [Deltaproteobacteria bacterium]